MNKQQTHEAILIMKAYCDGAEIEFRHQNRTPKWFDNGSPGWDFENYEYRIKPKPREFWIDLTDNTFIEAGKGSKYWGEEHELIKVVEVIE